MKQNEAELALRRDDRKDKVDLVFSVGGRSKSGDNNTGNIDEQDLAGGLRLEYQRALDKRGFDASIYQAQLNLSIAREDTRKVRDDLRYSVSGLLSELEANRISLSAHERRLVSEKRKLEEALERYRTGRESTNRLIDFENDMQLSRLALDQDRIALERRRTNLVILLGRIWQSVDYKKGSLNE
jgi:outer membrane protein TolC